MAPDGTLHIHSGVGNLGTYSYAGTCRAAAERLQIPWERCVIERGRSDNHLPHSSGQGGSNTIFTRTRTNWVAAEDMIAKMKAIAAMDLGGSADDYDIGGDRVFRTDDNSVGMTYAETAQRAMELGGRFAGEEYPDDINPLTQLAVQGLAGSGLIGVAKDNIPGQGQPPGVQVGFMELELDKDTGTGGNPRLRHGGGLRHRGTPEELPERHARWHGLGCWSGRAGEARL